MSLASEPRTSLAKTALAIAWLALAGVVAGVGGYLVIARQATSTGELVVALPPAAPADTSADVGPSADEAAEPGASDRDEEPAEAEPDQVAPMPPAGETVSEESGAEESGAEESGAEEPAVDEPLTEKTGSEESGATESEAPEDVADALPEAPAAPSEPEESPAAEARESEADSIEAAAPATQDPVEDAEAASTPQWQRFAATVKLDPARPRIAVVVNGLGLSKAATEAAIKQLPAFVTLSFSPYARDLNEWIALARVHGHEVMLDLPMEPVGFPNLDPGPHTLLTTVQEEENLERLDWILDRGTSYVGVAGLMGSRFTASESHLRPVLEEIKQRGLLFLDNRSISGSAAATVARQLEMPLLINDRAIDEAQASRIAIDARLTQIEGLAETNGAAVAMGQPYPVTIERLRVWTRQLQEKGFTLVPITNLATSMEAG